MPRKAKRKVSKYSSCRFSILGEEAFHVKGERLKFFTSLLLSCIFTTSVLPH
jgi:hypothetical protein